MSLTVKVSLFKENGKSDVRRFRLDEENINYKILEKKINEIFPDSTELMWKDLDGDLVTFSSDEEFREAFTSIINGVLKIFVSAKGNEKLDTLRCKSQDRREKRLRNLEKRMSPKFGKGRKGQWAMRKLHLVEEDEQEQMTPLLEGEEFHHFHGNRRRWGKHDKRSIRPAKHFRQQHIRNEDVDDLQIGKLNLGRNDQVDMGCVENEVLGMKRGRRFGHAHGRSSRRKCARYPKMTINLKRHNVAEGKNLQDDTEFKTRGCGIPYSIKFDAKKPRSGKGKPTFHDDLEDDRGKGLFKINAETTDNNEQENDLRKLKIKLRRIHHGLNKPNRQHTFRIPNKWQGRGGFFKWRYLYKRNQNNDSPVQNQRSGFVCRGEWPLINQDAKQEEKLRKRQLREQRALEKLEERRRRVQNKLGIGCRHKPNAGGCACLRTVHTTQTPIYIY